MKKIKYLAISLVVGTTMTLLSSCTNDLNVTPLDKNVTTSDVTFSNRSTPYVEYLAKVYAGLSTGGIQGAEADVDITGYDGGSQAGYLRPYGICRNCRLTKLCVAGMTRQLRIFTCFNGRRAMCLSTVSIPVCITR